MILKTPKGSSERESKFHDWETTLVPIERRVVAGPPGHPETETSLEDPARLKAVAA